MVSDHGAKGMVGGICINEWLIQQGYLVLREYPQKPPRLADLKIDWCKTRAWGDGGYYGRVFLNVRGREPQGLIPPSEYESFRNLLARQIEAIPDEKGCPIGTRRPQARGRCIARSRAAAPTFSFTSASWPGGPWGWAPRPSRR